MGRGQREVGVFAPLSVFLPWFGGVSVTPGKSVPPLVGPFPMATALIGSGKHLLFFPSRLGVEMAMLVHSPRRCAMSY